ncbi:nitrilase and fragile histidine triad fusion protein NitFhit [Cylas formicarius]|uniref:nitrilase and fragile histidine triad fusion protein NitFhit n=1 Tax=Cylas formicarius TaxID=197179 RepID=UPI002958C2B4|nr:nitrilase and fragile histidine triad fusion protein NitFhit [Cylas formicarius]
MFLLRRNSYCVKSFSKMAQYSIAVCQFTATNNKQNNLAVVTKLVDESVKQKAKMIFLPEAFDYIAKDHTEARELSEPLNGTLISEYKNLAKLHGVWLSIGGFHEKINDNLLYNSHIIIDCEGQVRAVYRKTHLFDISLPNDRVTLKESELIVGGSQIAIPIETPIGKLGLSICYDLRFPELSLIQKKLGASILTYPSAFTHVTGKAHWEILLRARAIETQCYVVAAAQYGKHNEKRISHGQSMIVNPWGEIVAECPRYQEGKDMDESIAVAIVDLGFLNRVRNEMPVFSHRRNDLYNLNLLQNPQDIGQVNYSFADKIIPASTVFYRSKYSFAFTNIRCVVPGHVLVSTLRVAHRLQDLSQEEIADLFQTSVKVCKVIETINNAQSSTICVQDGKFAGQTVPHVHVHILPRKQGDFDNNDDIYMHLAQHDKDTSSQCFRTVQEQEHEAYMLKKYFYQQ